MPSVGQRAIASVKTSSPSRRASAPGTAWSKEEPDVRGRALPRALDRWNNAELSAGITHRAHVLTPGPAVEVDRQQPARVVGEQRVDPHHLAAPQMRKQLTLGRRRERLAGARAAPHARLGANTGLPLVRAPRCPAASPRPRILPAEREHVLAPAKEAREQRDLALWRPRRGRTPTVPSVEVFGTGALARPAQLGQSAARGDAKAIELREPRLLGGDLRIEVSNTGHRCHSASATGAKAPARADAQVGHGVENALSRRGGRR